MNRIILSFLFSFILLMIVIALSRITYINAREYIERTEHSRNVIKHFDRIDVEIRSAEIFSPRHQDSSTQELYALYKADLDSVELHLGQLRSLLRNNRQQSLVDSITMLVKRQMEVLRKMSMEIIVKSGELWRLNDLYEIKQLIRRGLKAEEELLKERRDAMRQSNKMYNLLILILAILAIVIITITFINHVFLSKRRLWLEGFLESILNTSQNGILYYKAVREHKTITDFKVHFANDAVLTLLNVDPKKILGKRLTQFDSYVLRSHLFPLFKKALETGEPMRLEHHYANNGVQKWLYVSISKLNDGITVAFHDISALKGYEAELKTNITALEQSNRELEEYAYAASHDLQEPLRKIKTFGRSLYDGQKNNLDEKSLIQLDKILQSADRMSLLIKDLLSFSSLKIKDEFELTDLDQILDNVLQDMEVLIHQKSAIISRDPLPEIESIPIQINQLFYNLVNNSLKFSKDDLPLHLDISCKLLSSDEVKYVSGLDTSLTYYEIVFSDNGIGFNQEYAQQIFGLFKRLNDKLIYPGSGIGLALCKKVVINHSGMMLANGKENVGAQFYIYLPKQQKLKV